MTKYPLQMFNANFQVSLKTLCIVKVAKFLLVGAYLVIAMFGLVDLGDLYLNGYGNLALITFFILCTSWTINGRTFKFLPDNKYTSYACRFIFLTGFVYFWMN